MHWRVTKEDGDLTASTYGTQTLNTEDIKDFVPLENVTNEIVVEWVKEAMGEEVSLIEDSLDQQIEALKNPSTQTITLDN